jgi:cytochrome P450
MTEMQNELQDRPLPRLDVNDGDIHDHLYETFRDVRQASPVAYSERFGGYYMLTRYGDVRRAAMDHERFTTSRGVTIPAMKRSVPAPLSAAWTRRSGQSLARSRSTCAH